MARMTEKVTLPSNGLLYGKSIPANLTVQNLTADEESMLYGSSGDKAINDIVGSIVQEKIDPKVLTAFDRHFLLMKGRVLTYGPNYPLEIRCPKCGFFHADVDLNSLPIYELDPKYAEPWEIEPLPQSKTVLTLYIPNGVDYDAMESDLKRRVTKYNLNEDRARYKANIAINIAKIDGEDVSFDEAFNFVSELSGMDSSFLKKEINKIEVGYDTMIVQPCPKCGTDVEVRLPMTADFFRTEFRD